MSSHQECSDLRSVLLPATIVALLCTLINVALTILQRGQHMPENLTVLTRDYEGLEVGNSYINLDLAAYDASRIPPRPINNFPLVVSRINSQEPTRVYIDNTRKMSSQGLAYLEENEIVVRPSVSDSFSRLLSMF